MNGRAQTIAARGILAEENDFRAAIERISEELGRPMTPDALRALFRRAGMPGPSTFLGVPVLAANDRDTSPEPVDAPLPARARLDEPFPELPEPDPIVERAARASIRDVERILFVPDTHRPYHDPRAVALALEVGRRHFDGVPRARRRVTILGDFADFFAVSAHEKDMTRRLPFPREVEDVNQGLDEVEALDAGHLDFVEGNHEWRFARFLRARAPELIGLPSLSVPELFNLERRGWSFTRYMDHLRIGKLFVTHEEGNAGTYANIRARASFEHNVLIGHTHRLAVHYQGNAIGETHVGAMGGWLGDFEAIDYAHKVKARQWTHGVVLGFHEVATGVVHLKAVPFINGTAEVNGEIVSCSATMKPLAA